MKPEPSIVDLMLRQGARCGQIAGSLARARRQLDSGAIFSLPQAMTLAAVTLDLRPDLIIDLGTGSGASSFSMAIAVDWPARICTFDINKNWSNHVLPRVAEPPTIIEPIVADITGYDFAPMIASSERVLVFLDAHGFEVVARLLSHIMPLIADRPHMVFCHDISDGRLDPPGADRSYQGKRMWRGTKDFFANKDDTAYVNVGWMRTAVDQAIALGDFCYRNRIPLRSVDEEFRLQASPEQRAAVASQWGIDDSLYFFGLTYFSMMETTDRHFPRC
jgi:hypothetical protein